MKRDSSHNSEKFVVPELRQWTIDAIKLCRFAIIGPSLRIAAMQLSTFNPETPGASEIFMETKQ
jgi:hypothetical protein